MRIFGKGDVLPFCFLFFTVAQKCHYRFFFVATFVPSFFFHCDFCAEFFFHCDFCAEFFFNCKKISP